MRSKIIIFAGIFLFSILAHTCPGGSVKKVSLPDGESIEIDADGNWKGSHKYEVVKLGNGKFNVRRKSDGKILNSSPVDYPLRVRSLGPCHVENLSLGSVAN